MPELASYDWIVVNSSAGKDSQAMLDVVVEQADIAGVRRRIVVLHCDLGKSPKGHNIEWPGTLELVQEHAARYDLRFIVVRRGTRGFLEQVGERGPAAKTITALAGEARAPDFLGQVQRRGMWSSQEQRLCTSNNKRDPAATAMTALAREVRKATGRQRPRILQCFGFRAQESPRRRKMEPFAVDKRISNTRKMVHAWLPIHDWKVEQVWERIRQAGTKPHYAYAAGMTRLSCCFCIFAPRSQLILSGRLNPELLEEYVALEKQIGHTFRKELALVEVQAAITAGETGQEADDGCWNM